MISDRVRDEIISAAILIQEEKYCENLAKFRKQVSEHKDARVRVYSRLLKIYSDNFVLN